MSDRFEHLKYKVLAILEKHPGIHYLGPDLAKALGINTRTLRLVVRSLRFDNNRWDILSRPGGNVLTDGYWISSDPQEIENNRKYHEHQGLDHLARASRMQPQKAVRIEKSTGQLLMEFAAV